MQNVLVIHSGALGDTLLAAPALGCLRAAGAARIRAVGRVGALGLLVHLGLVDEARSLDDADFAPLFAPDAPMGERLTDFLSGFEGALVWMRAPAVVERLHEAGIERVASACVKDAEEVTRHASQVLVRSVADLLGVDAQAPAAPPEGPPAVPASLSNAGRRWLGERGIGDGPLLVVHPGSGSASKNWPLASYLTTARRFLDLDPRARALVTLGPADDAIDAALAKSPPADRVIAARGMSLDVLAGVLSHAAAFVGNDSGVAHLAALMGAPVVALFGPTDPALWAPLGKRVRVLKAEPMTDIDVGSVSAALTDVAGPA